MRESLGIAPFEPFDAMIFGASYFMHHSRELWRLVRMWRKLHLIDHCAGAVLPNMLRACKEQQSVFEAVNIRELEILEIFSLFCRIAYDFIMFCVTQKIGRNACRFIEIYS